MTTEATPPLDVRVLDGTVTRPPMPPTVFDDSTLLRADRATLTALGDRVEGADLAAPPVVLPDFHHKSAMELPSSVAVATNGTIRPELTSSSVNCGMALIAVDSEVPDDKAVDVFMRAVRERYPYPTRGTAELSRRDVVKAVQDGSEFSVDRWDAPADDLERIEEGGRIDLERYGGIDRIRSELPGLAFPVARYRFGTVCTYNHFVELQRVEEILDPERAGKLGVSEG